MGNNSYPGREYASNLIKENIDFDIAIFKAENNSFIEKKRTAGIWKPKIQKKLISLRESKFFNKLSSKLFHKFLLSRKYDIGIQGGNIGIIPKSIIRLFKKGIINLHPGNLPIYRGSSSPEFQILNNQKIICTSHFIDDSIDAGYLIKKKKLNLNYSDYHKMRASIYPEMAKFLSKIIKSKKITKKYKLSKRYKPKKYIGDKKIIFMIKNWNYLKKCLKN